MDTAQRMVKGANALEIPVIVTEQYPKALGNTVQEVKDVLNQDSTFIQDKLDFTMYGKYLIIHATWQDSLVSSTTKALILISLTLIT